jgi:protein-S-isoprenylcysteine O-methyltransferase Ste14
MTGILFGAASFIVLFWVDPVSMKGMRYVKPALWLVGSALLVSGVALCLRHPRRIPLPAALAPVGWALLGLFSALLLYSLFAEIPLAAAYVRAGQPPHVVSRGTYALCRHPGVLWFAGALGGLFLARGSLALLVAIPVWTGLDVLWVALQERLFFVRMFGQEYRSYQRTVPFLVPTPGSVRACARTIFR